MFSRVITQTTEHRVTVGTLYMPSIGAWTADVATDDALTTLERGSSVRLVVGTLTLRGTVVRSSAYAGATRLRLVGGHGGWSTSVAARGYSLAAGVPLALVLGDLARETGETVVDVPASTVGPMWVRRAGLASQTLVQLGVPWRVIASGETSITAWPASQVTAPLVVASYDPARGIVLVAADDTGQFVPGAELSAPTIPTVTVGGVVHRIDPKATRIEVWT